MNEVSTMTANRIRRTFEDSSWTVDGLPNDLTPDQGVAFLETFLGKLQDVRAEIAQTRDEATPADPAAIEALRGLIEELGHKPGPRIREGMTVEEVSRAAMHFGAMLAEGAR